MEIWKDVVGYEGHYQVSSLGRVKSLARMVPVRFPTGISMRPIKERILKPASADLGHLSVVLNKGGESSTMQVHTLVLEAFIGPRPGHHAEWHGCHNDGNPENNALTNLRWDTRAGNEADKIAHDKSNRGERNGHAKLVADDVLVIRQLVAKGSTSDEIAHKFGVSRALINAIKRGRAWGWL